MIARTLIVFALAVMCALPLSAQTATSVRIERTSPDTFLGSVVVTVDGQERTVAQNAANAWIIEDGRAVVYSSTDGAGGFENEGQSLWLYDLPTGDRRKLMTEVFMVRKVAEARSRSGKPALLVTMQNGGLGAYHVAVVDPRRGEVWRRQMARFVGVRNGRVAVGSYRATDFERETLPPPRRVLYLDLDALLRRPASPYWPVGMRRV